MKVVTLFQLLLIVINISVWNYIKYDKCWSKDEKKKEKLNINNDKINNYCN